jgi:hypothetical protein
MANANVPRGLVPSRLITGERWSGGGNIYYVPSNYGTAVFSGDPLIVTGAADANGVPVVAVATAGTTNYITGAMVGIINGGQPFLAGDTVLQNDPVYIPANTGGYILVADNPNQLFEVQEDSVGGAMPVGSASANVDLIAGAGSTVTGQSGWQLDSNTVGAGATLQMRILQMAQAVGNEPGVNAKWLCKINLHSLNNPAGV